MTDIRTQSRYTLNQPVQTLPSKKKDREWKESNLDWAESFAKDKLKAKRQMLQKNYNIAQGVIDVEDYIKIEDNDYQDLYDTVRDGIGEDLTFDEAITEDDLYFYPILPTIINMFVGERSSKFNHTYIKTIDSLSTNEFWELKKNKALDYIKNKVEFDLAQKMQQLGLTEQDEQYQSEMSKVMDLPQIQRYMTKNFRNDYEIWASKILERAESKYRLSEKEDEVFKHQFIADEGYLEIDIENEEIEVNVWNPLEVVCLKSSHLKYTSDADVIIRQYKASLNNVISTYKDKLDSDTIEKIEDTFNIPNDYLGLNNQFGDNKSNNLPTKRLAFVQSILDGVYSDGRQEVLVTKMYWVSQRRLAKLTFKTEGGEEIVKTVDDSYKITIKPVYDEEGELIYGEELEYFYAPQVWKGTKLNFTGVIGNTSGLDLDSNEKKDSDNVEYIDIQPLAYQFSDKYNPFKVKLPVAGCDGYELMNTKNVPLVSRCKPYQVMINSALNQADMLMRTEIGKFYVLDQKLIPKNSLDGSWGANNYLKWILTAKEGKVAPIDGSAENAQGGTFQQSTVIDLSNSTQIADRLKIAEFFRNELFQTIGVSPQRQGQIKASETASGIEIAQSNSYTQTDNYFTNHANLMVEFKTLLLDAEKYIESLKPESRVNYINTDEENIMFSLDTSTLPLRVFGLYVQNDKNYTQLRNDLKQLALTNNTTGASILDLFSIVKTNSVAKIEDTLRESTAKMERRELEARQNEQLALDKQLATNKEIEAARIEAENLKQDKEIAKDLKVAEIMAIGRGKDQDLNNNQINDVLEIQKTDMMINKAYQDSKSNNDKNTLKDKEIQSKERQAMLQASVDREANLLKKSIEDKKIQATYANMKNDLQVAEKQKNRNK